MLEIVLVIFGNIECSYKRERIVLIKVRKCFSGVRKCFDGVWKSFKVVGN
jgi:hypothetical protein